MNCTSPPKLSISVQSCNLVHVIYHNTYGSENVISNHALYLTFLGMCGITHHAHLASFILSRFPQHPTLPPALFFGASDPHKTLIVTSTLNRDKKAREVFCLFSNLLFLCLYSELARSHARSTSLVSYIGVASFSRAILGRVYLCRRTMWWLLKAIDSSWKEYSWVCALSDIIIYATSWRLTRIGLFFALLKED